MLKKIFIILIKYIPVIEMTGIIINNTLYYFDFITISGIIDYLLGDGLIHNVLLFISSIIFGFCNWHRLIIISNVINLSIASFDKIYHINITNIELLYLYYFISSVFIILATYVHIKYNKYVKHKNENIETVITGIYTKYRCW